MFKRDAQTYGRDLPSDAGATLIEIMAALFIIATTATFIFMSLPGERSGADVVRTGLLEQTRLARHLSTTTGEAYGLYLDETSSTLMVFRRGEWVNTYLEQDIERIVLPGGMTFEPDERRSDIGRLRLDEESEVIQPQIWFDPSGIASFEDYHVRKQGQKFALTITRNGEARVEAFR